MLLCLTFVPYLDDSIDSVLQDGEDMIPNHNAIQKLISMPKEFVGNEIIDGKTVFCKLCPELFFPPFISSEILTPDNLKIKFQF